MSSNIEIPTEGGYLVCVICCDKIGTANDQGEREQPVQLDCQHVFGNICLDFWLTQKKRCPLCRAVVDIGGSSSSDDGGDFSEPDTGETANNENEEDSDEDDDIMDEDIDEHTQPGEEDGDGNDEPQASREFDTSFLSDVSGQSDLSQMSVDANGEGQNSGSDSGRPEIENEGHCCSSASLF
jgi:hypothetical protein